MRTFIFILFFIEASWANYEIILKNCATKAPLEEVRKIAQYSLAFSKQTIGKSDTEKAEILRLNAGKRGIIYEDKTLRIFESYFIGLSKRPYFKDLCFKRSLKDVRARVYNDLIELTKKSLKVQQDFIKSGACMVTNINVIKKNFPNSPPIEERMYFNLENWLRLQHEKQNFSMLVHTLRLRQMMAKWLPEKFQIKFLNPQPSFKDPNMPQKISTSLLSNYRPFPVAGSFLGLSLKVHNLDDLVTTGVKDINSNAHNTFQEMIEAGRKANFSVFKRVYKNSKISNPLGFERLNPEMVAALTRGEWNEVVFKGPLTVDSYVMWDLSDKELNEPRFSSLDPANWENLSDNFKLVFNLMGEGCKKLSMPLKFITVEKKLR